MKKLSFFIACLFAGMTSFAADLQSEYCGQVMSSGNTEAAFTWETDDAGSVVITISETLGGAEEATHFRGNGINLDKFKIGDSKEDAATYFDLACGGSATITLSLKEGKSLAQGTKIYVNDIIEYATSKDGNAWPTLSFEYSYGGKCLGDPVLTKIVLSASANYAKIGENVTITATAKDQLNKTMSATIAYSVTPADAGTLKDGVFTPAKLGAATITASSGSVTSNITVYCVPSDNLAVGKTVKAGYEPENQGELSGKTVDGDENTLWVTWADQPADKEWLYIDLGDKYDLTGVEVIWGGDFSTKYIIQGLLDAPAEEDEADDEAWNTMATVATASANKAVFTEVNAPARYLRIHSLTKSNNQCIRIREIRVFGSEWMDKDDQQAPVMVSAALDSKGYNFAVIAVEATDNGEIAYFHVVDAANKIDKKIVAEDGKITVNGLEGNTEYNFTITVVDRGNNESENNKLVTFTTDSHVTEPGAAAPAPKWPAAQVKAIYSPTYNADCGFGEWGSGTVVSDEQFGKKYVLAGGGYFGLVDFSLNCALMEMLHFDFWIENDASVRIVPIWGGEEQGVTVNLKGQQWNSIDIAKSEYTAITDWTNIYQVKIDNAANLTLWMGNAYFYRTTEIVDDVKPENLTAEVAATTYFTATLSVSATDNMGVINYVVLDGDKEVATGGGASGAKVNITVSDLLPDTEYNLSVIAKDDKNNATDPVSVKAKTLAAPAPAPAPDLTDKEVVGIFSDAIPACPAFGIGGWGQSTVVTFGSLAEGDKVCFASNFNYLGWELSANVNAGDMTHLHADFYSTDLTKVSITPISAGHEGEAVVNLKQNEWTSADIELSSMAAAQIDWTAVFQFKFFNPSADGKALFIDNIYFYKANGQQALENTTLDNTPSRKVLVNGAVLIERNGHIYNILGTTIK